MLFFIFFFSISSQNEENEEEKALSISPIKFLWQKEIRGNFIFICTYDGFLHKVNVFSGKIIYSIKTGNLFFKSSQNQNVCFLPSIDGNIFSFANGKLIPIFCSINDLIQMSPFTCDNGDTLIADKSTSTIYVDENGSALNFSPDILLKNEPDPTDYTIIRVTYDVNIIASREIFKITSSDITILKSANHDNNDDIFHNVSVLTSSNGEIIISVDQIQTSYLFVYEYPVLVTGPYGRFDFIGILNDDFNNNSNSDSLVSINENIILFPKFNQFDIDYEEKPILNYQSIVYSYLIFIGINLEVLFLFLIIFKKCSHKIVVDKKDRNFGIFNHTKCSIIHDVHIDNSVIKDIIEMNLQYILQFKAYDEYNKKIIIASQLLLPYQWNKEALNNKFLQIFLKRTLNALLLLFQRGYVHGAITKECFYIDSTNGEVILGGLEKCCHKSNDRNEHKKDIQSLGKVISEYLGPINDPILVDLLYGMQNSNSEERLTAKETLNHPFFFSPTKKLEIIEKANNYLQKNRYLRNDLIVEFDRNTFPVVGKDWTRMIDPNILNDALNFSDYTIFLSDLIRLIRNKWKHLANIQEEFIKNEEEYFSYFHTRFPNLFLYTYYWLENHDIIPSYVD